MRVPLLIFSVTLIMLPYTNCAPKHSEANLPSQFNAAETLRILQGQALGILSAKCATCHAANFSEANLKDILDVTYLQNSGYLVVGSPQESLIYLRIIDGFMPPMGSPQLSDEEVAIIRDWISALGGDFNTIIGGIENPPAQPAGTPGKFSQVSQILQSRCSNCHGGQTEPTLTLPYNQLITETTRDGARIIVPRDVGQSRLYQAVVTNNMPRGQAPLTNAQKEIIRSWIAVGAMND